MRMKLRSTEFSSPVIALGWASTPSEMHSALVVGRIWCHARPCRRGAARVSPAPIATRKFSPRSRRSARTRTG